jgi:hypothetical protein
VTNVVIDDDNNAQIDELAMAIMEPVIAENNVLAMLSIANGLNFI